MKCAERRRDDPAANLASGAVARQNINLNMRRQGARGSCRHARCQVLKCSSTTVPAAHSTLREEGVRLAQKTQVGPRTPVGTLSAVKGPTCLAPFFHLALPCAGVEARDVGGGDAVAGREVRAGGGCAVLAATRVLGWPKRHTLAHAFL
jgi:hypothetical protein